MSILDKENWNWISTHKFTFILLVLIAANVYQYIYRERYETRTEETLKESLEYERNMSIRLENFLEEMVRLNADKK